MVVSEHNPELVTKDYPSDKPLFDVLIDFLELDGWVYKEIEYRKVIALGIEGQNGRFDCYGVIREEEHQLTAYSVFPVKVPHHKRYSVAALITMLNYGVVIGAVKRKEFRAQLSWLTKGGVA